MMYSRLLIARQLLREDGVIFISIDDNEVHHLRKLCEEVFGEENFLDCIVWQKTFAPKNDSKYFSSEHEYLLVFLKSKEAFEINLLERGEKQNARYSNPDNDKRGVWKSGDMLVKTYSSSGDFTIITPSGRSVTPPNSSCWRFNKNKYEEMLSDNRIWFGKDGDAIPSIKRILTDVKDGLTALTIWLYQDVGHNQAAKKEVKAFNETEVFATPKPEKLMQRILTLATNQGDLVLDSFAGSGTTGAVAHKMGRRWIMVELGEHCHTHIVPRLKKVINGEDQGGISKAVQWKGGGGFRYYNIAPSMLEKDRWDNWIISKEYNPAMLSEALCKIMGFKFRPSEEQYWIHGHSTETDFIYVTTQTLDQAQLASISQEVGDKRTLLVCCGAFRVKADEYPNLTLKKIPRTVLNKCEWGKDDYSLNVQNLPISKDYGALGESEEKITKKAKPVASLPLFEEAGE